MHVVWQDLRLSSHTMHRLHAFDESFISKLFHVILNLIFNLLSSRMCFLLFSLLCKIIGKFQIM